MTRAKLQVLLEESLMRLEVIASNEYLRGTPVIEDIVEKLVDTIDLLEQESENEDNLGDDRGY